MREPHADTNEEPKIMSTLLGERIEAGDVIELDLDGVAVSALVLLASEDAAILDPCDGSTPFVLRREELTSYRRFDADDAR
jgi:hypothetical protein